MARDFAVASTAITLSAVWAGDRLLGLSDASAAFIAPGAKHPGRSAFQPAHAAPAAGARAAVEPGPKGLLAFGVGYGALAALVRVAGRAHQRRPRASMQAADIEVAEKTETKPIPYLANVPRTFVSKRTLEKLLSTVPKEQWDNPPEDSYLYTLKLFAETYGEGKATRMGWWDYWWLRVNAPEADEFESGEELAEDRREWVEMMRTGKVPLYIPGPSSFWGTGISYQWRGPEPFAGDQVQTVVSTGSFAMQYLNAMAFYREGLKPWQRGLEIGMAHGYFLIGPFVSLGPLRNTPEAATVGLLAGCATIGAVSLGGLLFGATIKPPRFDKPGDKPGSGFQEMINWHAIGGLGGAGFAHALLTVFGS